MNRFGMRNVVRYGGAAGILLAVAVAVAIAAATADATPNKPYTANVHQTLGNSSSMTFTVTNDPHASQTVGSANFTAPSGLTLTPGTVGTNVSHAGWTAVVDSVGILELRSNSSANALTQGQSVRADVTVTLTTQCTTRPATPGDAAWQVQAKQSNDFSGSPGNFMQFDPTHSDLTPLGSFVFGPVESVVTAADGPLHVPQIIVNQSAPISITALDTCGNVDADYSGGTFGLATGLALPDFSGLTWSQGVGSATVTPVTIEVGDQFSIIDGASGISANSVSTSPKTTFDVVETICAKQGTVCVWTDKNKPITATSTVPGDNNGHASLGLGYKPFRNGVTCGAGSPVGDSIYIDPYQYTNPYTIVLTYAKSLLPKGPASNVVTCKSIDDGVTWDRTQLLPCSSKPVAPCADAANIQGGALQITLYLEPGDPHSGGFSP
ncbi:MAG: hypothetical protein ACJ752_07555 [Gaiellaceae bacterium]